MTVDEQRHKVAECICGKKAGLSFLDCLKQRGLGNAPCASYGKCRIEEKSKSQLEYILSNRSEHIFLKACPGSGKTEVVALKAAQEMRAWDRFPGGIAVLTFTNNAADVISERVCQCVGADSVSFPHFIGTFDSWLHGYIGHPFFHHISKYEGRDGDKSIRIIDSGSKSDFLNAYRTTYGYNQTGNPKANQFFLDLEQGRFVFSSGNNPVDMGLNKLELKDWQVADLRETKAKFNKAGFATYQDVENSCYYSLCNADFRKRFAQRFPYIIVDECQDLSWIQMQILKLLITAGSTTHFVGDLDQAIYGFKEVAPEKVSGFTQDNSFTEMPLLDNFRSVQPIVDVCQKLVRGQAVNGLQNDAGLRCLYFAYKKDQIEDILERFEVVLEKYGAGSEKTVVLARGKSTLSKLRPSSHNKIDKPQLRLAMSLYLWHMGGTQAREDSLSLFGKFVAETFFSKDAVLQRSYSRPESIKSNLQWRLFLAETLKECCRVDFAKLLDFSLVWTKWAAAVRNNIHVALNEYRRGLEDLTGDFPALTGGEFRSLQGKAQKPVEDFLLCRSELDTSLSIKTIHAVKGETYDAVMLVSAPTGAGATGGHWKEWLKDPNSEHARFAYVASSRPRKLLVWAIPDPSTKDKRTIEDLGFVEV